MSQFEPSPDIDDNDLMKILVATDIHLGYNESDPIRGNDSFIAFEEILQNAVDNDVDFILLAGDLFHDAKPSVNSLQKCMKLLRRFSLGNKRINIEFLSDQSLNFGESLNQTVNYEDPNINVAYPVFSIHGNHDDPCGLSRLSSLDILSVNGLVNYFGRWTDLTKVNLSPILLKKGQTKLALYGLSHIHDNRLARLFSDCKVNLEQPDQEQDGKWFNILVLHQNRANRGLKNYLPEEILPDFLDLVIWGHEHDCRIIPEENATRNFYVSQPGSSVATSLAEGEALDKHCGLLIIHKEQFKMNPIKLKTVRPFIFDTVNLIDYFDELKLNEGDVPEKVKSFITERIAKMIDESKEKLSNHPNQPTEPLIRLRILCNEEDQMFNTVRFGQQYKNIVANSSEIIMFKKILQRNKNDSVKPSFDNDVIGAALHAIRNNEVKEDDMKLEDVHDLYFEHVGSNAKLEVLQPKIMNELFRRLVHYNDVDAAEKMLEFQFKQTCDHLNRVQPTEENIPDELINFKNKSDEMFDSVLKILDNRGQKTISSNISTVSSLTSTSSATKNDDDDQDMFSVPTTSNKTNAIPTRGRGGRGSRGGGSRGGRGATTITTPASTRSSTSNENTKKTELNVSIQQKPPATRRSSAATVQPSIQASMLSASQQSVASKASKSAHSQSSQIQTGSGRLVRPVRQVTHYISDSDSD